MQKALALGGPQAQNGLGSANGYPLATGCVGDFCDNASYLRESNTAWARFQVSWWQLQEELGEPAAEVPAGDNYPTQWPPADLMSSWEQLNLTPNINEVVDCGAAPPAVSEPALRRLDREIRAANDDGIRVILNLYHDFPTWTSPDAHQVKPVDAFYGRDWNGVLPSDLSTSGPWAWFIGHLLARYAKTSRSNTVGPTANQPLGNPAGAWIDALEICNEPNLNCSAPDLAAAAAQMIRTACSVAAGNTSTGGPTAPTTLLVPALSDFPDPGSARAQQTDWLTFTEALADNLNEKGFKPPRNLRWSMHNYNDIRYPDAELTRVERTLAVLTKKGQRPQGQRPIWLTEGGYRLPEPEKLRSLEAGAQERIKLDQALALSRNFRRMADTQLVNLWSQYKIGGGDPYNTDLLDQPPPGAPATPRPAWHTWREL